MPDLDEILSKILMGAQQLLGAHGASIFLLEGDSLVLRAATGLDAKTPRKVIYKVGEGFTGRVATGQAPRLADNSEVVHNYDRAERPEIGSLIATPIRSGDRPIGVLRCVRTDSASFDSEEMMLLEIFAGTAAAAIDAQQNLQLFVSAPYMFALMPFDEHFQDVYELGIKPAAEAVAIRCERVDEIEFNNSILEQIYKGIQAADLVVADMTGRNPNVYYEVGYAHALHKEVVLLTQRIDDIPFDLKSHNHIVYGGQIHRLRTKLEKRLRGWVTRRGEREPSA